MCLPLFSIHWKVFQLSAEKIWTKPALSWVAKFNELSMMQTQKTHIIPKKWFLWEFSCCSLGVLERCVRSIHVLKTWIKEKRGWRRLHSLIMFANSPQYVISIVNHSRQTKRTHAIWNVLVHPFCNPYTCLVWIGRYITCFG